LPSLRDESWRYTDLRSIAAQSFAAAACESQGTADASELSLLDAQQRAATLTMVNGCPLLEADLPVIKGLEINSIRELYKHNSQSLARFFEMASDADQRWVLLNTALFIDGLYLKITEPVSTPIVIRHVGTGAGAQAAHPRIIIDVCAGASAVVIEHHLSEGDASPLTNSNTHIALARDAQLEHYRVFASGAGATHLDSLDIHQAQDSQCRQFTIALGGGLVRSSLEARLNQRGAALDSYSLLVGHQDRHVDCVNIVTHAAPDTRSRQTARAIASDESRVIFNSKVIVNKGANGSDSKQSCRGLLLSPSAEIDTRPQLEIHADEVKCAHGATTGRLDPDMLFYLLSRGLDRETAQSLLVFAFLADVLTGMSVSSARSAIESALISQLPDSQILRNFR
jgi:Fe-S cluster assembly protein SufD